MILIVVDVATLPGKRDEFVLHVHELLSGGPHGLLQYTLGTTASDLETLIIVEEWQDEVLHKIFIGSDKFATFEVATKMLVSGTPRSRQFTIDVPAGPKPPIISLL
jgi:quinol monooxygenase YgiN